MTRHYRSSLIWLLSKAYVFFPKCSFAIGVISKRNAIILFNRSGTAKKTPIHLHFWELVLPLKINLIARNCGFEKNTRLRTKRSGVENHIKTTKFVSATCRPTFVNIPWQILSPAFSNATTDPNLRFLEYRSDRMIIRKSVGAWSARSTSSLMPKHSDSMKSQNE